MSDLTQFMETGRRWRNEKREQTDSRLVTYRRPSTGEVIENLLVSIGQSQLENVNLVGTTPDAGTLGGVAAETNNRDYIVTASRLGALWPPQQGDLIDDPNDGAAIQRFQTMKLPGLNPWRWLHGGRTDVARIHTKFFSVFKLLWGDTFSGSGSLLGHTSDSGGSYQAGTDDIQLDGGLAHSAAQVSQAYFEPPETVGTLRALMSFQLTEAELEGARAEIGLGMRCTGAGATLRDGYYGSLRVQYLSGLQTVRQLRISRGASLQLSLNLEQTIVLDAVYTIKLRSDSDGILLTLSDEDDEIPVGSVRFTEAILSGNTTCAMMFNHDGLADPTVPWIDTIEAQQ